MSKTKERSLSSRIGEAIAPFFIGGLSGCTSTMIIQPIDFVKAIGKGGGSVSPFTVVKEVYQAGGARSFYKGLDSALLRQIFYTTSRMGLYKILFQKCKTSNNGKEPSLIQKSFCAMTAGFIGAVIGNPADLALVRMQADTMLPVAERRNYTNVGNAFSRIVKEEGVMALWRGSTPTVTRAVVLNLAMLAPYDEVKERLNNYRQSKDTQSTRLISSLTAGFLASFSSLPFDNAKTKIQKMKAVDGVFPYKNIFDVMFKTVRNEGVTGLWAGFPTYYFRIAPHVAATLLIQDHLTDMVKRYRSLQQH